LSCDIHRRLLSRISVAGACHSRLRTLGIAYRCQTSMNVALITTRMANTATTMDPGLASNRVGSAPESGQDRKEGAEHVGPTSRVLTHPPVAEPRQDGHVRSGARRRATGERVTAGVVILGRDDHQARARAEWCEIRTPLSHLRLRSGAVQRQNAAPHVFTERRGAALGCLTGHSETLEKRDASLQRHRELLRNGFFASPWR